MPRVRDDKYHWTPEADEYISTIKPYISNMIQLGENMGFDEAQIFYLVVSELDDAQLINILKKKENQYKNK
jgi:hypothetical protein